MRLTHTLLLTASVLASSVAMANSDPFIGPSVAFGASIGDINNETTNSDDFNTVIAAQGARSSYSQIGDKASVVPLVDFSWNVRIAPTWIAGAGVNLETTQRNGPENILASNANGDTISTKLDMKNQVGVYGLVGKQLGDSWMLYGKTGYYQAKAIITSTSSASGLGRTDNANLKGYGIGFGATHAWKNGLELRMEGEYIAYQKIDNPLYTSKPSLRRVNVLLGYRF